MNTQYKMERYCINPPLLQLYFNLFFASFLFDAFHFGLRIYKKSAAL